MTRIKLPFVHRFRDRHGVMRFYFRRPGYKRATLPGLPGSAEFMAAYQAALGGAPLPIGEGRDAPGTIGALIARWYQSADFKQLRPTTQATYRGIVERFREDHGSKRVAKLEPQHVRQLLADRTATPAAANNLLRMVRLLMRFAIEQGWRQDDPTLSVRRIRYRSDGFRTWSEDDISAFQKRWAIGTRARLALALLLYTAQRRGDVIRMGPQHVRQGVLEVRQGKTGERLALPVHHELATVLAGAETAHLTFLTTEAGRPFASGNAFYNWFSDCIEKAGLPKGLSPHGLRKAAARRLAEAGCTANEIAAMTGHATLKEVERYTRAADQKRMAGAAILKISGRKAET